MGLCQSVKMKIEYQARIGFEVTHELFRKKTVGAEIDVSVQAEQFSEKFLQATVQQGLAPGNRDHRSS